MDLLQAKFPRNMLILPDINNKGYMLYRIF